MSKTVLIVGASGVIGEAACAHFASLRQWTVIALSRRKPWVEHGSVRHLPLDLTDPAACVAACAALASVTHVIYAAVSEQEGLVAGWRDAERMDINLGMLRNLMEPLAAAAPGLAHVTLLQGAKAYGGHAGHQAPLPAREAAPRDPHANFYWLQEDYIRAKAAAGGFAWTIFRPCVVVGGAWGVAMNPLLALGAYAARRREEGAPFSYTGGTVQISEIVDTDLLAEAFAWAAEAPHAASETFNITNGDVFAWRDAWPALADAFGLPAGPDEPMRLAGYLTARAALWDAIVIREGLRALRLPEFLGQSHHYADILLRPDAQTIGRPTLLSTIKLRQAGFNACRDSETVVRDWIRRLQDRALLPRPD